MPVLTVYARGVTLGLSDGSVHAVPPPRSAVTGWSSSALRRNTLWLYGVDADRLPPGGLAATLTLRDCPPGPAEWAALRTAFFHRLRRAGLARLHWVVEWQRRGVPHMHLALWLDGHDPRAAAELVLRHWLDVAARYRPRAAGQAVEPLRSADGWTRYVSRHAARGILHYQRRPEARPPGWSTTGRMWGHCGDWPMVPPVRLELSRPQAYIVRRWCCRWLVQDAERRGDLSAARWHRVRRSRAPADVSAHLGLSEWVPAPVLVRFFDALPLLDDPRVSILAGARRGARERAA